MILLDAISFVDNVLDKIVASNSIGLVFSVFVNYLLFKGYKSEKDYNRERDLSVTKIITLMQSRLEDMKQLSSSINSIDDSQKRTTMLIEQTNAAIDKLKDN